MSKKGIAILLGAGPTSGAGVARAFVKSNYAVALLSRNKERLEKLAADIKSQHKDAIVAAFATDTSRPALEKAFKDIKAHADFKSLPVKSAIWHVKHSSKGPFMEQSDEAFGEMFTTYILGAKIFAQLAIPLLREGNSHDAPGTLLFTGTLGALRCSAQFASYGISRSAVRQLSQSLAREYIDEGLHVVHTVVNGGVGEDEGKQADRQQINSESLGDAYVWLTEQKADCFVHELDLRPSAEKF